MVQQPVTFPHISTVMLCQYHAEDASKVSETLIEAVSQDFCLCPRSAWGLLLEVCDTQMLTLNVATVIWD